MLIGKKVFPYPLLRNDNNEDYNETKFSFEFNTNKGQPIIKDGELILENIHFILDNPDLNRLYDDGALKAFCEVECSKTVYRECFEITREPINKTFLISNFSNQVIVSAFMVATKEINDYESDDFSDDYKGYKFHINPSCILAADDGYKFRIDVDEANDDKISSIFTIVKKDDAGELVTYFNDTNKIIIYVNPGNYEKYETLKLYNQHNNVFFSTLVIPVLSNCLKELQNEYKDNDNLEDICDNKNWFKSVLKRYSILNGKELDKDEFNSLNCYELAQSLMDEATAKSIDNYYDLAIKGNGEEEDYDD